MRKTLTTLCLTLAAALAAPALAQEPAGKATFEKKCAGCHGKDGRGNEARAKALKLDPEKLNLGRDEVASQTKEDKKRITTSGEGKMPAYGKKLSPAELNDVVTYAVTLIDAIRKQK